MMSGSSARLISRSSENLQIMKSSITIALLALTISATAQRGQNQGNERDPEARLEQMAEELELTQEQRETLRLTMEQFRTQMQEQREAHVQMRQQMQESVNHILTDEQREKLQSLRTERRQTRQAQREEREGHTRRGERHGLAERNAQLERLKEKLDLTPEQLAQIEEIQESNKEKMDALRAEHQALRESMKNQIMEILTKEQLEIFRSMDRRG